MTSRAKVLLNFVRYSSNLRRRIKWKDAEGNPEGVKYGYITYFPRHPNEVDPAFEPSKLFIIKLVKPFKGNPWWEKNVLKQLGFDKEKRDPVICKNTPSLCAMLWKVKHLVVITPITLPDNMPTADDLNSTYLHLHNGKFSAIPKVDPVRIEATENFTKNPKKLDGEGVENKLRWQWNVGRAIFSNSS
ncbi:hypothetical protein DMN91_006352 [Ooceraea biroi]|uniref:Large ribosomal subunit protein uL30m n=1 Tax=Ooceraea biroi TaxID=2015173 RepID=A0A026VYQ8_OOCBI|nr:39S ribosomal protein L30, mitochondrial [Ooceraea biroi]XP_011347457.1 39S ribosomal protein L30, mitochondrial [Ooceraea biroi]EZA48907.1 39S ribosomal protein L30, mitochondrial [Ooceraea biroi]RLU21973.1 hypothetical protein DMN91_006352 [Ooceraea biroi]